MVHKTAVIQHRLSLQGRACLLKSSSSASGTGTVALTLRRVPLQGRACLLPARAGRAQLHNRAQGAPARARVPVVGQRQRNRDEQPRLAAGGAGRKRAKAVHRALQLAQVHQAAHRAHRIARRRILQD